jgi:pimeloyl-ACP methyl ester carboxylesterase
MLLAHDIDGSGEPVVLLHSGVADRRMWSPQWTPLLEAGFRPLRLDIRGHGETPAPTEPFNNADDVRALLDSYDLDRVVLVGSSYGGMIAQEFAARWPERVSRLALLCPARAGHERTPDILEINQRENELIDAGDIDGAVALCVDAFVGPAADDATRSLVDAMQRNAYEVQLAGPEVDMIEPDYDVAAVTAPTLVVSGALDLPYFDSIARYLVERIPAARRVTLDWAGHLPSLEDPVRFNPVLLEFLSS